MTTPYKVSPIEVNSWQQSVKDKDLTTAPGSPSKGDRYIMAGTGGNWSGGAVNDITYYDGSTWIYLIPLEGWICWVEDENLYYYFNGSVWSIFGGSGMNINNIQQGSGTASVTKGSVTTVNISITAVVMNKTTVRVWFASAPNCFGGDNPFPNIAPLLTSTTNLRLTIVGPTDGACYYSWEVVEYS